MTTLEHSFSARYLPWAKIGKVIDDTSVTSVEAAQLGGIDFDVELRTAGYWKPGTVTTDEDGNEVEDQPGSWVVEPSRRAIVRPADADEAHDTWISYVSTDYRPVQYREAFAFMDTINPNYVAAGSMSHGRRGFMVVQLPELDEVGVEINGEPDPHQFFVVLQTSHDLSKGINIAAMPLRNKCMNMLTLPSFMPDTPQNWSIRHIGDPLKKLQQAQETLTRASNYRNAFQRTATQMASVRVTDDDLRQIVRRVLPDRPKRDEQIDSILNVFKNAETVGFYETGWGALNAVSDYFQWQRGTATRTEQSEFTSGLDGDTAKYVNRTAQLVMQRA